MGFDGHGMTLFCQLYSDRRSWRNARQRQHRAENQKREKSLHGEVHRQLLVGAVARVSRARYVGVVRSIGKRFAQG
jgi:hypothetical protein